jgi:hypothetical protein
MHAIAVGRRSLFAGSALLLVLVLALGSGGPPPVAAGPTVGAPGWSAAPQPVIVVFRDTAATLATEGTKIANPAKGTEVRLRTTPDDEQQRILDLLGVRL